MSGTVVLSCCPRVVQFEVREIGCGVAGEAIADFARDHSAGEAVGGMAGSVRNILKTCQLLGSEREGLGALELEFCHPAWVIGVSSHELRTSNPFTSVRRRRL